MKCSDETKRADKADFEGKRNADKLQSLQREKEGKITSFLDSLQSAAALNKKLRFETSHDPMLVIL